MGLISRVSSRTYRHQMSDSIKNDIPLVKKQVGKTHCGLASIAHFIQLSEEEIHAKMNFVSLPEGLTLEELSNLLSKLNKKHNILRFKNASNLENEFQENWEKY